MRSRTHFLRAELIGIAGVIERNLYLTRRYIWWDLAFLVWTVANTLTIVFIGRGIEAERGRDRRRAGHHLSAHRRGDLGLSRHHLRVHHGDGRVGAGRARSSTLFMLHSADRRTSLAWPPSPCCTASSERC
jgi:hypothetical protein